MMVEVEADNDAMFGMSQDKKGRLIELHRKLRTIAEDAMGASSYKKLP